MPKNTSIQPITPWEQETITITESREIRRLQLNTFSDEIGEALNVNKGLLYTFKGLTIAPGKTIRNYLGIGRYKVMNPLKYLLVLMTIFLLIAIPGGYFESIEKLQEIGGINIENNGKNVTSAEAQEVQKMIMDYMHYYQELFANYFNFWMILTVGFISVFSYLLYKKRGYNFLEHLVVNLFAQAHVVIFMIVSAIFTPFVSFEINSMLIGITTFLGYLYFIWVYKQVFQQGLLKTIIKSTIAYVFGASIFSILLAMIIFVIFFITHRETFTAIGF
ncbi:DUF3667 domain-containing protein [Mesonia sp. K7]|uniref:DUF3667 domain-containing protein n=1 Tax=Mesonia sp. K7 TaxID=2218606 RepID=UPI000DAA89A0|nr:DUF3667 domain-containing protein [Mesonia sp. K7]PZD76694.1 hypothetical protein DNG35_11090 [Mesonia sp. K7]